MTNSSLERALKDLLEFTGSIEQISENLNINAPADRYFSQICFTRKHIIDVLDRFLTQSISAEHIEEWANAVESTSDYLRYDSNDEQLLRKTIHTLANPTLTEELSAKLVISLRNTLQ